MPGNVDRRRRPRRQRVADAGIDVVAAAARRLDHLVAGVVDVSTAVAGSVGDAGLRIEVEAQAVVAGQVGRGLGAQRQVGQVQGVGARATVDDAAVGFEVVHREVEQR